MKKILTALIAIIAIAAVGPLNAAAANVQLKTSLNNWNATYTMNETVSGSGIYSYDIEAPNNMEFVIVVDGTERKAMTKPQIITLGTEYSTQVTNEYDYNFRITESGLYTVHYYADGNKVKVTDANHSSNDPEPDTRTMHFKADKLGWNSTQMTQGENYTWTHEVTGSHEFVIVADNEELKHNGNTFTVSLDTPYTLYSNQDRNHNFKIEGSETYIVTVDASDKNNLTVTVSKKNANNDPTPLIGKFYFRSNVNGWPEPGDKMDNNNNVWTITKTFDSGNIQFAIRETVGQKEYKSAQNISDMTDGVYYAADNGHGYSDYGGNNFAIRDAGTYVITFDATDSNNLRAKVNKKTQTVEEEVWSTDKYVYFNAGFDWDRTSKINGLADPNNPKKLYAHFIKKGDEYPAEGSWRIEMESNADRLESIEGATAFLPLFRAVIPENYEDFDGVQFEVEGDDLVYNSKLCDNPQKYDSAQWWKFIFGAEKAIDADHPKTCRAEQSFMTYEQYRERRDNPKEAIYFLGSNLKYSDGSSWHDVDWSGNLGKSEQSEGVYIFEIAAQDPSEDIRFKMSWVDVNHRMEAYNSDVKSQGATSVEKADQRWWATFNLGLVGPTLSPVYGNNFDLAKEYGEYYSPEIGATEDNGAIRYSLNRCRQFSRYNLYDWFIKSDDLKNDETTDNDYYVVVDVEYNTTALVAFRPAPTMSEYKRTTGAEYTAADIAEAERFGNELAGSDVHGTALIDKVNVINGEAKVNVSKNIKSLWDNGYMVDYEVYYFPAAQTESSVADDEDENEPVMITVFHGNSNATESYLLKIENLPYEATATDQTHSKLGVRCTYTDKENSKYFNADGSPYVAKFRSMTYRPLLNGLEDNYTLNDVKLEAGKAVAFLADEWHAHASMNLTTGGNDADFNACYLDIDPDYRGDKDIHFAEASEFAVAHNICPGHYTKADADENYSHEDNNWARIKNGSTVNFIIESIHNPAEYSGGKDYTVNFVVKYPFLVGDNTPEVSFSANNKEYVYDNDLDEFVEKSASQAARRRVSALDSDNKKIVFASNVIPVTVSNVGETLSGIADVTVKDANAEYFNLQGIRVEGYTVPGVYIVRRGDSIRKEMVQ